MDIDQNTAKQENFDDIGKLLARSARQQVASGSKQSSFWKNRNFNNESKYLSVILQGNF